MAQQVSLTVKDTAGSVLGEYTLNAAGAPLQIDAVNNVYYEFAEAGGRGPAAVSGTRSGDDLIVSIDGNNRLIIKDYFTQGQGALVGMQADGTPYIYAVTDSAPEHLLASETGIATAAGSSLPPAAVAGIIGGVALTAGGIAIAKHNHDKHHHDDNITPQPQPNPTPNPQPNPNPNPQPNPQPNPNPNPQPSPQPNHEGRITITGEAKVGQTLTAAITDADGVPATGIRYQWYADGQVIDGATGSSYTLTAAEKGKTITVQARYTDNANNAESPGSYATDAVREGSVPTPNHAGTVTISGDAKVGATLTAAISDSDGVPNTGITYQWLRDGVAISGETNNTYTLTRDDAGHKITVRATYKDNAGHDETPLSAPLDVENTPTPPTPNSEGQITISGEGKVGSELTAAISDSDGVPTSGVRYQWLRDGVAISGQTGNTYQLTQDDAGHKITVRATYKDNAGHDETPLSAALDVENIPPQPQPNHAGTITISGEAKVGATLTAAVTDADGTAQADITYNWYADGVKIGEGANYTLTAAEKGKTITVRAVYKDNAGHDETPLSAALDIENIPIPPTPNHIGTVTISGEAKVGSELTAAISDSDGVPTSGITYQWLRDGVAISGETGSSYTLTRDDTGHKITVRAVYKDNAGHDEAPTSAPQAIAPQDANHLTVKETDGPVAGSMQIGNLADGEGVTIGNTTLNLTKLGNLAQQPQTVLDNDKGTLTLTGYDRASGTLHYTYDPKEQPGSDNMRETIDVATGRADYRGTNGIGVQPLNPAWGANLAAAEESYARAAKLGVKWVRVVASWHRAQAAENGDYDWEDLDAAVKLAQKYGMKVLMQVTGTPEWASGADQLSAAEKQALDSRGYWVSNFAPKPEHDADYAKFMAAVVRRYAPQGIQDYEVWNEPGNPGFWHDSPGNLKPNAAHYTNLLKLAYQAAHEAAPDVNVLAGGMTVGDTRSADGYTDPRDFLEQMYAAGAKGHFDTLSHHPYGITSGEFKSNGWALMNGDVVTPPPGEKTLKQIMQEHGDGDKKIWATEVGREAIYQGLDETQQAAVIKTLLEQHAKNGEGPLILYQAQNDRASYVPGIVSRDADGDGKVDVNIDTDGDGKPDANLDADGNGIPDALDRANREDYFGLWTQDGKEKPAVGVIRAAAGQAGEVKHSTLTVDILDDGANPAPVNHAPTDISLSADKIAEGKDGATVGKLTTTDPDSGDTHTYTVSDSRFEVTADGTLKLKAGQRLDYATEKTVDLTITATDSGGLSVQKRFYVFVQDDPGYPAPPANHAPTGRVTITGEAVVGKTLTAANDLADEDGLGSISYHWLADGVEIGQGGTYTLTAAEKGKTITVKAVYTDGKGTAEAVESSATAAVADDTPPPANHAGAVAITGEAKVGSTLTATVTDADEFAADAVQYQWLRDGQAISGQTGATYQLTRDDAGHNISVKASYKDNAGHDETPTSTPTATIADNPQPNHPGKISISGEARVGNTLTAIVEDSDSFTADNVQYQWQRDGVAIKDASGKTYTLTAADLGHTITVKASYTDHGGHAETPENHSDTVQYGIYQHTTYGKYIDAGEFGVDPTGATDSTAALKAALAAAQKEGAALYLGKGTLKISEQLAIDAAHDKVTGIFGDGMGKTTVTYNWQQKGKDFNWNTNLDDVRSEAGILVDGQSGKTLAHFSLRYEHQSGRDFYRPADSYFGKVNGILVNDASRTKIDSVEVSGANRAGIHFTSTKAVAENAHDRFARGELDERSAPGGSDNQVINSHLHHNRVAGVLFAYQKNITVAGNELAWNGHEADGGTGYGAASMAGSYNIGVTYRDNHTDHNYRKGLDIHDGEHIHIENNRSDGDRLNGIAVYNRRFSMTDVTIRNNTVSADPDFRLAEDDGDYSGKVTYHGYTGIQIQTNTQFRNLGSQNGQYTISGNTIKNLAVYQDNIHTYAIEYRNHERDMDYTLNITNNHISGDSSKYLIGIINDTERQSGKGAGSGTINISGNTADIGRIAPGTMPIYIQESNSDGKLRGGVTIADNRITIREASDGVAEILQVLGNAEHYDVRDNTFNIHGNIDKPIIGIYGYGDTAKPSLAVAGNHITTDDGQNIPANWIESGQKNGADAAIHAHNNTHNGTELNDSLIPVGSGARATIITPNIKDADYAQLIGKSSADILDTLGERGGDAFTFDTAETQHNLIGTLGDDVLIAASGADRLVGRKGADQFVFITNPLKSADSPALNQILDLNTGEDRIRLVAGKGETIKNLHYDADKHTLDYDLDDSANHTYHNSITLRAHDGHTLSEEEVMAVVSIL